MQKKIFIPILLALSMTPAGCMTYPRVRELRQKSYLTGYKVGKKVGYAEGLKAGVLTALKDVNTLIMENAKKRAVRRDERIKSYREKKKHILDRIRKKLKKK